MSLRVRSPGLATSVQDAGRRGGQHLGVGPAGAADPLSHALANLLAGNPAGAAALELTLRGPSLVAEVDLVVAFAGAPFPLAVDGTAVPANRALALRRGSHLEIGEAPRGLRGYLAVAGGVAVPKVLGSCSTDLKGGFGGLDGRALRAGDLVPTGEAPGPARPWLERLAAQRGGHRVLPWRLPWAGPLPGDPSERPLRLIPGPHWDLLADDARRALVGQSFRAGSRSDRMGLRLDGPALALAHPVECISAGVATGTLQLPPEGGPILLLADRQTVGGYPRLGEIASVDLPWAAQLRPGDSLRFQVATVAEAQAEALMQARRLDFLARVLAPEWTHSPHLG